MPTVTRSPYVDIDGVPLATPAWEVLDLAPLLAGPDQRGSDVLIPGAAGVLPQPRRATVSKRSLPMVVYGDYDQDGAAVADGAAGLIANLDHLRANVTDPTGVGDGTRTLTLHLTGGATRTCPVHVEGMDLGDEGVPAVRAVLRLSFPSGMPV